MPAFKSIPSPRSFDARSGGRRFLDDAPIAINTLARLGHQDVVEAANVREGLAQQQRRHVPVLMVTTNAAQDEILEALRAGVDTYVVKSFSPETIKEKIDAVMA